MNISIFNKKCANCGACINKCPTDAIFVDESGNFYNPVVDNDKCIDCGACVNVCPVNNDEEAMEPICAYGGWNKNRDVVMSSSSGGVFFELANQIMADGGYVYSAVYAEDCKSVVFASNKVAKISRLQKSKYVESLVGYSFREIKEDLNNGIKVLFCGTPCQVAGLKKYLGEDSPYLITCDFICGGLPSHKLYFEHLEHLEKKYNSKISYVDFRPKTYGWQRYAVKIKFDNGRVYNRLANEDSFLCCFLYGRYTVRDYCLQCKFKNNHISDITISDFWNYQKFLKQKNLDGVSLVLCNNLRGREALGKISNEFWLQELNLSELLPDLVESKATADVMDDHNNFLKKCDEVGFERTYRIYFHNSPKTKLRNIMVKLLKREH